MNVSDLHEKGGLDSNLRAKKGVVSDNEGDFAQHFQSSSEIISFEG